MAHRVRQEEEHYDFFFTADIEQPHKNGPADKLSADSLAESMETAPDRLAELYKVPPLEVQSYDDWKQEEGYLEPPPDYSDDEDDGGRYGDRLADLTDDELIRLRRQQVKEKLNNLSKDEYDRIVAAAEADGEVEIPEPDYYLGVGDGYHSYSAVDPNLPLLQGDGDEVLVGRMFRSGEKGKVELIQPKKLMNPCVDSRERQQLHREMLMNQKLGVDVLQHKSELKKEMERRKETQMKKETEDSKRNKRTSFELKLEERAQMLHLRDAKQQQQPQQQKQQPPAIKEEAQAEFLKVHSKIKNRSRSDDS